MNWGARCGALFGRTKRKKRSSKKKCKLPIHAVYEWENAHGWLKLSLSMFHGTYKTLTKAETPAMTLWARRGYTRAQTIYYLLFKRKGSTISRCIHRYATAPRELFWWPISFYFVCSFFGLFRCLSSVRWERKGNYT